MTEELWQLPTSWAWAPVRELGRVVSGGTPSTKDSSLWDEDVIWFSPADLTGYSAKFIRRGAKSLSDLGLRRSSATVMPAGSVMFSSRAPIGYVAINEVPAATNQGFKSVVPGSAIFNEYLYYYLKASKQLAEERATGTTFKEISGSAFSVLPVPVAPLREQHRIVAKIEELFSELDKAVESLTLARAQLKTYRQSLLKAAFEGKLTADWRAANPDKLEPPETLLARIRTERHQARRSAIAEPSEAPTQVEEETGWAWASVDMVTADNLIGLVRAASEQNIVGEGVSYIKMDRIDMDGRIDVAARVFVKASAEETKKYALKGGDLLFNTRNSLELGPV